MVFTENGDHKLIDFDLAAKVGQLYPSGYNADFKECHPEAKRCEPQAKVHDRHSLIYLVTTSLRVPLKQVDIRRLQEVDNGVSLAQLLEFQP